MHAVTTKKQLTIWPVILGVVVLAGIVAIATWLNQQTIVDDIILPGPVPVTFAIPDIEDGPVPGMPRDTFESVTSLKGGLDRPMGMPDDVWQQIDS